MLTLDVQFQGPFLDLDLTALQIKDNGLSSDSSSEVRLQRHCEVGHKATLLVVV